MIFFGKMNLIKAYITSMVFMFMSLNYYAKQIPTVTGILKTDPSFYPSVHVWDNNIITVPVVSGSKDYNVRNTISLKYDLNTDTFFLDQTDVKVQVIIDRMDANNNSMPSINTILSVSINNKLNKPFIEKFSENLIDGYEITMTIQNIWINGNSVNTLPRYVSLESEINLDRYYDFSSPSLTSADINQLLESDLDCDGINDEIQVSWPDLGVQEEYQLEWFYVSNYSSTGGTYPVSAFTTDFKNNSTRITTTASSYKVSLLYPNGYIVFRVRAVGRDYLDPSKYIYGPWSAPDQANIGSLSTNYWRAIIGNETIKNWQYSGTYAEEGKKKEVISYFDGSLHNRQTVTKFNSDNHVIVGETLYDFQGRPAINILPVPANLTCTEPGAENVIRYYPDFNVNHKENIISKTDFDSDNGSCVPAINNLGVSSGAARYYSTNNPDTNLQQAFLPDAKGYPYTQTEYTPDNTGRIRAQSGLGPQFVLSSGKETRYLYGQPNQLQIDRLFGSEAGDASHYKKNIVTDANGQASVTYLNQEGQTIATALAGVPPSIGVSKVTRLDSLEYAAKNQTQFKIDLFNKDALGNSILNSIPPSGDELDFLTQLLVPFRSVYDFSYNLQSDALSGACLRANVCVSCIYDLEIQVKDECGTNLVTSASPFKPLTRVTGNVDTTGNKLTFNVNCAHASFKDSAKVSLILNPGVYTVSKILKVNQQAKDYYVKKYTDSVYNSCIKTLYQFQKAELALIDTSDCYNTCAGCVAALGSRDDFVSSARGTAEQWDFLVQQCNEPCRLKTLCQEGYEMLLSDVSPGGQYGKYNTLTIDASGEPISVYNVANVLASNTIPSQHAHWKKPMMRLNGNIYTVYMDENGVRTKVNVTQLSPGIFQPPVDNPALVYFDNTSQLQYTYPENLQNLSDFIANWNSNFASSLVMYHPEYAYYVSCAGQSVIFSGDTRSSDMLDSLLFATESFSQAVAAGFILPTYTTTTAAVNKIKNIWTAASGLYDPFFTNSAFQYSTIANIITGEQTGISMVGTNNYNVNLQAEMNTIINNYSVLSGTVYTMMDVAAILTRCGNNFGSSPAPSTLCLAFGADYTTPSTNPVNDTIRNKEWRLYRQLYFAEKQKLQFKRMNFYAKYSSDMYSNYYGGCNACLGNSGYDAFGSNMITLSGGAPNTSSPYFDTSQPCSYSGYINYPNVTRRFYDPANTGLSTSNTSQQLYQTTGQCQVALELQIFLNAMASTNSLTASSVSLSTVAAFSEDLYELVNAVPLAAGTSSFNSYVWNSTVSGQVLTANFSIGSTTACVLKLDKIGTSITSFTNITGITQLQYNSAGGNAGAFKAVAIYTSGTSTLSAIISGTSSCMSMNSCNFNQQCTVNQFGSDMVNLLSYLQSNGSLASTSTISISTNTILGLFLTPSIKNNLGSPNTNIVYQFVAPDKLTFYDSYNPGIKIIFTYTANTSAAIKTFSYIKSNGGNFYTMAGRDVNGNIVAIINGEARKATSSQTTGLSVGNCGLPDPTECQEKEHKVRKDLELLVSEILSTKPFNSNVNMYSLTGFSPLLRSYESATINASGSTYTSGIGAAPNFDTLTIRYTTTPANAYSNCNIKLYHYRNNGTVLNFNNIVSVSNLTGIGLPDIAGNYFSFKALASYSVGTNPAVTDTIYGYSCWPVKNCNYCENTTITGTPTNITTYTYSTAFNRATNRLYNHSNDGNVDPWWSVVEIISPGSTINYSPSLPAYDVNPPYTCLYTPNAGYLSLYSNATSPHSETVIYRTTFSLPNPLPSNKSYTLLVNARADDGFYDILVNGVGIGSSNTGGSGNAYSGSPICVHATTLTGLAGGTNTIDIQLADNGAIQVLTAEVLLKEESIQSLCVNGPPDSTFVFPLYKKYDNPCARQKVNLALQNAANKYQQYINDFTTTFANAYTQHCLAALEKFTYKYVDKEYHHTLYYYDQAGNLIKTIPPEGVEYLPVTAYTDVLEQKIINDRTTAQQNVFTTHRMATKYEYNSLNQLIFQSVPDHDNMDICDGLNPNGLDTSLIINAIQFITPNKGYLCGEVRYKNGAPRGYVYTSTDGGNFWTRVNNVTSGDLQKVQFISTTEGYAVSNFGMVFKTADGGDTWDLLTGLYNPVSGSRYVDVLNDLYFTSSRGIIGGIAGSTAPIFYTTDGGNTFSPATVSGSTTGDTITGITFDGTTYIATSKNAGKGKIFTSATNGVSWSQAGVAANNLKKVQFISNSLAYALGEEGTLMKLNQAISGNPIFQLVPTGMPGSFMDVYFKNATDGVAIIDSVSGKGKIFKTFNAGVSWQLLSANGDYYNSLKMYDATNHKLIAAGKNGLLAKVLLNTPPFGITKISTPIGNNISYADAYEGGVNGLTAIGISDVSHTIFNCYNAQMASPTWFSIDASAGTTNNVPASDALFKKVILLDSSATTPYIKGILLTVNGKLYSFYKPYNTAMIFHPVTISGVVFNDITANGQSFTSPVYAFDTISKKNYRLTFAGTLATGIAFSSATAITKNINAIDINNSGNNMIMVGNSGHIEYTSNLASTTTWADLTLSTIPVSITKVKTISSNNFIAVGIDGAIWKNYSTASAWYLKNSGTVETFNSIAVDNSGKGLVAGNHGKLFQLTDANTQAPVFLNIPTNLSVNFTDAALEPAGTSAYATANNGQVLYMTNYNTLTTVLAAWVSPYAVNGVAYKNGPNALVVGNNALVANYYGTNAMVTTDLFPKGLISIHFSDANNGYVIDSSDVVRKTTDGGTTWSVILPQQGAKLTKVFSMSPTNGIVIGLNVYAGIINNTTLNNMPVSGIAAGTHFYDINFEPAKNYGIVVGSSSIVGKVVGYSIKYLGQATGSGADFRAVHVFNNTSFIASGTKGSIYYYKNGIFKMQQNYVAPAGLTQNNLTLKDIYFHDDYTGYVVGNNSAAYKVNLMDSIGTIGTFGGAMPWLPFCASALNMNYTTSAQLQKLDFNAVACPNRTQLMIGGADGNLFFAGYAPNRYARLLKEQSGYYSSRFWYDKLGRMVVSQNTKQFNKTNSANAALKQAFSYTLYDALGRITEVGEKFENHTTGEPKMNSIFGSFVNSYYNNNVIDEAKFSTWINASGSRREITKTYYDIQNILPGGYVQQNLRKRVASTTFEDVYDANDLTYNHATHYSYDIHGNVNTLWQENTQLAVTGQNIKQTDYDYDLISGKVNKVMYSPGQADQFIHRYSYDADNRITMVETSNDDMNYDLDAKYFYYAHGPLARIEYGKNQVQGIDYAYTLQGWAKGVNSNLLHPQKDIGRDGYAVTGNPNGNFARDIMGYSLHYYQDDYNAIDKRWNMPSTRFEAYTDYSDLLSASNDLFNGNISAMVTTISQVDTIPPNTHSMEDILASALRSSGVVLGATAYPLGNSYRYDQLNRLKRSASYTNIDTVKNEWRNNHSTIPGLYRNTFTYDANGNIKTQVKRDSVGALTDSLIYNYETVSSKLRRNRLYHMNDFVTSTPPGFGDITDQGAFITGATINGSNNYVYDEIGNLIRDHAEEIDTIRWTVYGKIKSIIRTPFSTKDNLYFDYDASGNRAAKHDYTSAGVWNYSTYYLRDAQGNVLSVYTKKTDPATTTMSYKLNEQHLYGSSRLGMTHPDFEMIGASALTDTTKYYLGLKSYELSNHLGNVLSVISDKKIGVPDRSNFYRIDHYLADQISATDYYAFGSPMPGRNYTPANYKYGFNGQEKDDEIAGSGNIMTAEYWEYDTRLGRRWNIDPVSLAEISNYTCFKNNPTLFTDLLGDHVEGDYYGKDGKWKANDGKKDNKTYFEDENGEKTFGIGVFKFTKYKEWFYEIEDSKLKEYMPTLLKHEGGFVNNKNDAGGATNKGITIDTYKKYAEDLLGVEPTLNNLYHINDVQAAKIYEIGYWNPSKSTKIDDKQLGWMYFDTYLNGGGNEVLKSTLGNFNVGKLKGIDGINSLLKTNKAADIFYLYRCERICRFENLAQKKPSQKTFLDGWKNRANRFQYKIE